MNGFTIESIAEVCHEANRALCVVQGDHSQAHWLVAEEWQRSSAVEGVRWRLENIDAPASAQHEKWMSDKIADGWQWGEVKDAEKKTHPCLVPFEELPPEQQAKDVLFANVVRALCSLMGESS